MSRAGMGQSAMDVVEQIRRTAHQQGVTIPGVSAPPEMTPDQIAAIEAASAPPPEMGQMAAEMRDAQGRPDQIVIDPSPRPDDRDEYGGIAVDPAYGGSLSARTHAHETQEQRIMRMGTDFLMHACSCPRVRLGAVDEAQRAVMVIIRQAHGIDDDMVVMDEDAHARHRAKEFADAQDALLAMSVNSDRRYAEQSQYAARSLGITVDQYNSQVDAGTIDHAATCAKLLEDIGAEPEPESPEE